MSPPAPRVTDWLPRPLAVGAVAAMVGALIAHAFVGFQGAYLNHTSAVWLTLARDLSEGVFYRDLISETGYGATRYFPLFFSLAGLLIKAGSSVTMAAWCIATLGLALVASGVYRAVRTAGGPPFSAAVFGAAGAGSYFIQQTVFEGRADVLAAGLNLWGVALVLPLWFGDSWHPPRVTAAAVAFALAFATKITALVLPAGVILVCVLTRQHRVALRLAISLVVLAAAFFAIVYLASAGRAFEVWAACLLAGSDSAGTVRTMIALGFLSKFSYSHLVWSILALTLAALVVGRTRAAGPAPPWMVSVGIWASASAAAALTLSSPGTVATNQLPEWIAVSFVAVALAIAGRGRVARYLATAAGVLVIWMAVQNVTHAMRIRGELMRTRGAQSSFVNRVRDLPRPILAESGLWPILAGREVFVADAFSLRVAFAERPQLETDLISRISARRFGAILLDFDPASPEGVRMYEQAHFGPRVIAAIQQHYVRDSSDDLPALVFVPRSRPSSY